MSDTLLRQWEMLRTIPRHPKKIDVTALAKHLESAGFATTKRSIQRDLNALSKVFPLQSDEKSIPYGWSWSAEAPAFDLPAMDAPTALTLRMVEQFLPAYLPASLRAYLRPHFQRAHSVLAATASGGLGQWADRVRVVPREMPLLPPTFHESAVQEVYGALLAGKRFNASYRSRAQGGDELKQYEVSPLGLVIRGNLLYLICTLWNYTDIRQLALHRIEAASITDTSVTAPLDFNLDRYIAEGELQIPQGPMFVLKAKFTREAAAHLYETPLSNDQVIEPVDEEHVLVTATVRQTAQLQWWLNGFGRSVEFFLEG